MSNITIATIVCVIYLIVLLYLWRKSKSLNTVVLLWGEYFVTAIFCFLTVYSSSNHYNLSIINQFYLILIVYIFISPFINEKTFLFYNKRLHVIYRYIANFYILISIFSCVVYLPTAYDYIMNPRWQDIYNQAHEIQNTNVLTKISNLFFHFRFLGLVLLFYFISFKKVSQKYIIILSISVILPLALVAITKGSRGGMVSLIISLVMAYALFNNSLSLEIKKNLRKIMLFIIPFLILYLSAITMARFNDSVFFDNASASTFFYLGHSFLKFDDGIMDSISRYSWGGYFWGTDELHSFIRNELSLDSFYGTHFGTSFYTFIGGLYLDFGPLITFLIAIIVSKFIKSILSKRFLSVADYFIVITYAMFILNGVFVVGIGYGIQLIESIIIYKTLNFFEKKCLTRLIMQ